MKKSLEQRVKELENWKEFHAHYDTEASIIESMISLITEELKNIDLVSSKIKTETTTGNWITIDYSVAPKETFDRYGAKPFQIMEKKMRNDKGEVWNNISFTAAKAEAEKLANHLAISTRETKNKFAHCFCYTSIFSILYGRAVF